MAVDLFVWRFSSSLAFPVAHELHLLTGMRIGDLGNPYRDTPGSGQTAGTVYLTLGRGEQPEEWYCSAFTHDLSGADLTAVALLHAQMRTLLTALARDAVAVFVAPALPPIRLPEGASDLVNLGEAMVRATRYGEAVAYYTAALAVIPCDADVLLQRAVCLHRLGQRDDALIDARRAIAATPQCPAPYAFRASMYAELGRHLYALADLAKAQALEPTNPEHWVKAGLLYYGRGSFSAAVDRFSAALALRPGRADLYYYRGCAYYSLSYAEGQSHRLEQAADDFAQAERRAGTLEQVALSDVLVNRIAMLVRVARPEALGAATASVTRLLAEQVADPPPAALYLLRADLEQRTGAFADALEDCDRALALAPSEPRAYTVQGITLASLGLLGDALGAFSQAVLLAPDSAPYLHNRAIALGRMGRYDDALAEYSRAILLDPHNVHLYSERGEMHAALGQLASADADYRTALALAPDDLATMLRLGALLGVQRDLLAAMTYLDRVLERGDNRLQEIARITRDALRQHHAPGLPIAPLVPAGYDDACQSDLAPRSAQPRMLEHAP